VWCNVLVSGDQGAGTPSDSELAAPRAFDFILDHGQIGLAHFTADGDAHCFPFEEQFCFTNECGPTFDFETVWECLGSEQGGAGYKQLTDLDRMFVALDIKMSTDQDAYPMFNPADVTLKNQVFATLSSYLDQLDSPGHGRSANYDDAGINLWQHSESFSAPPPPGDPRPQSPPVTVDGTRAGTPVDIQCQIAHTDIYLPAELTLDEVNVFLNMSVEHQPGAIASNGSALPRRMLGQINIRITTRVKLKPQAYAMAAPFTFIDPADPFDLRIEDGANPGSLHPVAFLIPRGPDDCRIPLTQRWQGTRGYHPYAKEPAYRDLIYSKFKSTICRGGMYAMDGEAFFGEVDHHYDPTGPQRYDGSVTVFVDGI